MKPSTKDVTMNFIIEIDMKRAYMPIMIKENVRNLCYNKNLEHKSTIEYIFNLTSKTLKLLCNKLLMLIMNIFYDASNTSLQH